MIDKLEFLLALEREKHFGRAAEACHVSQPSLSSAIRQLEATLGMPLVERGSRFIGFTPEGERTLAWARRIVGDARAMREDLSSVRLGLGGHLRVAVIPTALLMVSRLTTAFAEKRPLVRLSIFSRNSAEILRLIEDREIDAGLTYIDNEPLGRVAATPLYRERYVLVTGAASPFAGRTSVGWAEVGRIPLCLLTPDMQNRRILDHILAEVGASVETTLESNSIMVIAAHVRTGRWSTVLPRILVDELGLPADMPTIPIREPEVSHTIGLVTADRDLQLPLVQALVAEAKRLAPQLAEIE